jgi:hypothetical protein
MDPAYVVRVIASMANTKFDPRVVAALQSVFDRGGFRLHRAAVVSAEAAAAATAHSSSELRTGVIPATPEITDIRS